MLLICIFLGSVLIMAACGSSGAPTPSAVPQDAAAGAPVASAPPTPLELTVVTAMYPLQYLAQRIGGDRVKVMNVTPPGAEPHAFEPSPRDMAAIYRGDVFIYNGVGFEGWVQRVLSSLPSDGPIAVRATEGLSLLRAQASVYRDEAGAPVATGEEDDLDEEGLDPHVWLDPRRYGEQADLIEAALVRADPAGSAVYGANLEGLKRDLELLEEEMEEGLASCARDTLFVSHAAFGYMAERYGLHQLAIGGLSPEVQPSPARLRRLIEEVEAQGVTHIFFEELVSPAVAETVAREVGAETLVLHPLGGLTREEVEAGEDYFAIMRKNLASLRKGLGCR